MNPNKALWEKGDFTRLAATMRESGDELVEKLAIRKGMKVLDLGCGDGTTAVPEAQRGAEMADRAVRLVPDFPDWSAKQFSNAYFMVGRYEDALAMLDRLSPDNDTLSTRTTRAAALAAVSQTKEAMNMVGKTIAAHPDPTVESIGAATVRARGCA